MINNQVQKKFNKTVERNKSYYTTIIFICISLSCIWSSLPLFGWSYYSLQDSKTSCCIEWRDQSINVLSYNIFTFGVVYLIPLVIIISLNSKLIFMVCLSSLKFNFNLFIFDFIRVRTYKKYSCMQITFGVCLYVG